MKNLNFILGLILASSVAMSQPMSNEELKLVMLSDTLTATVETSVINVRFRIGNSSNSNFIFYELGTHIINDRFGATWPYCEGQDAGAAIVLLVFDSTGRPRVSVEPYLNDLKRPMTKERFDSVMSARRESYQIKGRIVVNGFHTEVVQQQVDLNSFSLKKGQYFIQLLYFAGRKVRAFITEEEIQVQRTSLNADVFQGCLISNKSVLIIQ